MAGRRFEVISDVTDVEAIAVGRGIRELGRLRKRYGRGRWRKGRESLRSVWRTVEFGELHWYEGHGIGRKEVKRKRYVPEG